jgi:putative tricarboxylic transport membrane protein
VTIRNPKDFWSGVLFLLLGVAAVLLSTRYSFGTAIKMGPGYFPTVLGALLSIVGLLAILRSLIRPGARIEPTQWKPLVIILGSALLFGVLVRGAGLLAAVALMVIAGASASHFFQWRNTLWLAAGLTLFCAVVFVKLLGLPIPLIGPWFGG